MQGFLLGLASGTACLAYCAPALLPYILGEGRSVRDSYYILIQFLGGRLAGYLCFGFVAWFMGALLTGNTLFKDFAGGLSYLVLAGMLAYYGFKGAKTKCMAEQFKGVWSLRQADRSFLFPVLMGLMTGINLCPPFLLAFTGAAMEGSMMKSLLYFFTFFLGTSVFFIPLPLAGTLAKREGVRMVGKTAALLMAVYYIYSGSILILGGIYHI